MTIMNDNFAGITAQSLIERAKAMVKVFENGLERRCATHEAGVESISLRPADGASGAGIVFSVSDALNIFPDYH